MSSTSRAIAVPDASPRPDSSAPQSSMSPSASGLVSAESPRRSSVRPRSEMVVSRSEKKALAIGAFVSGLCGAGILHGIWAEADHNQAGDFGKFSGGVRFEKAVMPNHNGAPRGIWGTRWLPHTPSLRAQRSNPEFLRGGSLDCF